MDDIKITIIASTDDITLNIDCDTPEIVIQPVITEAQGGGGDVASVFGRTGVVTAQSGDYNSDQVTEGATNLYFTSTEQSKLAGIEAGAEVNNISDVNATDLTDGGETTLHSHPGGGGGTPGGSDGEVQFNNSGAFGGDSNFTWDNTFKRLGIGDFSVQSIDGALHLNKGFSFADGIVFGDGNTGIYESADNTLTFHLSGSSRFIFSGNLFGSSTINGPGIVNETSSATNPTFIPRRANVGTGLGSANNDQLSLITNSLEGLRIEEGNNGATGTFVFIPNLTAAPSVNPSGGGILYVEAGSLKFRGSSGTVTTIAPA